MFDNVERLYFPWAKAHQRQQSIMGVGVFFSFSSNNNKFSILLGLKCKQSLGKTVFGGSMNSYLLSTVVGEY